MSEGASGQRRPPWWPENEPWPPRRASFPSVIVRRLGIALFIFFAVAVTLSVISGIVWGRDERQGPPPFAPFFLVIIVGLLFFVGTRVAQRYTRPLGHVLETVNQLASGDYSARASVEGAPRELQELGDSVNTMATRLATGEEQRRSLVADVAHEVRTPLSVIRGNVEGILDGVYPAEPGRLAPILDEVDVIARLIEDLQTLSSAEAGLLRIYPEQVDLAALLEDVAYSFEPTAATQDVTLAVHEADPLVANVDPDRVRQVLENLISNALRHTPPRGTIELSLEESGQRALLRVADNGSGIPPQDLPHIFERYRKTPDSTGSGLGLAIARRLVEAHGGSIAAASAPGRGTTITVMLPVDRDV